MARKLLIKALCALAFAGIALFPLRAGGGGIAEKIEKAYAGIKDIRGSFTQKNHVKALAMTAVYEGTLLIKMPSMLRWSYAEGGNITQEVLVKGDTALLYQPPEKQAFRSAFSARTYGRAPVALLGGFGRLDEEFAVSESGGSLILTPLNPTPGVERIEVKPSDADFPISSFIIWDRDGNSVEIILRDIKTNTGISEAEFGLSIPEGVSVYEHNL